VSLTERKREIEDELKSLPETLEDGAHGILLNICTKYFMDINNHLNGHANRLDYYSNLRPFFKVLKQQIEATKPKIKNASYVAGEGAASESRLSLMFSGRLIHRNSEEADRSETHEGIARCRSASCL
jgi:hypothetical protein